MPSAPLPFEHNDYSILDPIVGHILSATNGPEHFRAEVTRLLRTAIDEVIDAPRTGRFVLSATEKTEKTYLGTKIEILLRNKLGFAKGTRLDMSIGNTEVDIKTTMGRNWSIPPENIDGLALLVRTDEAKAICDIGLGVMKDAYLSNGRNRDGKRTISIEGQKNIWWILKDEPYPPNLWERIDPLVLSDILGAGAATARLARLFEKIQGQPISRTHVQAIAQQHDYMKRIRRNGGARDILAPKGIAILWGEGDKALINELGLGPVLNDEFISHRPRDAKEAQLLRRLNQID